LEILDPRQTQEVQIADHKIPLEADLSAPLAYGLQESRLWNFETKGLFSSEVAQFRPGIFMLEPYAPEKIPVVFVHGTASSPARWADTFNSLESYPLLREKFQFWFFIYTTGNPIPYSANILRQSLRNIIRDADPRGRDPALRQMVIIAHSQGGLLAKMLVADSHMELWDGLLEKGVDPSKLSQENQELLKELLIFQRSPFVSRVAFLATPHRGSFLAARWYSKLGSSMISVPGNLIDFGKDLFSKNRSLKDELGDSVPTSLDQMDPSNHFIQRLAALPLHSQVKAHSIIAVKQGMHPAEDGNDGVVEYRSAHLEGVESEIVVPSSHSCQSHPATVQELRRILLDHLHEMTADSAGHEDETKKDNAVPKS
jgi:triacylglycerol esterase/lipase EstA (alpha/beta hydrolase family)